MGDLYGYHGYPCISTSSCIAPIAESNEKQHFLAHECKIGKRHLLGWPICNDTHIPIYLPLLGSTGDWDGESLYLHFLAEIQRFVKQGAISSGRSIHFIYSGGINY